MHAGQQIHLAVERPQRRGIASVGPLAIEDAFADSSLLERVPDVGKISIADAPCSPRLEIKPRLAGHHSCLGTLPERLGRLTPLLLAGDRLGCLEFAEVVAGEMLSQG